MQPSPLQLRHVRFLKTLVAVREEPEDYANIKSQWEPFNFNETTIQTTIGHGIAPDDPDSKHTELVITFELELPNEGKNPPPYVCSVSCVGYFSIAKRAFPDEQKRIDVAVVNGASMLYGIIREMICNLTARGWYGELLLPSANFQNQAPSAVAEAERQSNATSATSEESSELNKSASSPPKRKRTTKSK